MKKLISSVTDKGFTNIKRETLLTIFLVLFGMALLTLSLWQFWKIAKQPPVKLYFNFIVLSLGWFAILSISLTMVLYPFRNYRIGKIILQIVSIPLLVLVKIGYYYTFIVIPILSLSILILIPLLISWLLQQSKILVPTTHQVTLYVILVITSICFVQLGEKVTHFLLVNWLNYKLDFSRLYSLLRPPLVRVYTYIVMSVAYIIANIEKFSGLTITKASWWMNYKDVLVEVLLTYVAIDSVLVAWDDYRKKKSKTS